MLTSAGNADRRRALQVFPSWQAFSMIHARCPCGVFGSSQRASILRSDRKPGTATRSFLLVFCY